MTSFRLAVVRPIAGKAGELICTRVVSAESVSEAVKHVRSEFDGSGFVVMQEAAYKPAKEPMNDITHALLRAYDASV